MTHAAVVAELGVHEPPLLDARTRALLTDPVVPLILRLAWPNLVVMLLQASTGLIETYWVGRLGPDALAGMAQVVPAVHAQSDIDNRVDRYRDALAVIRAATEGSFPQHRSRHYGVMDGSLDMLPKPVAPALPIVAIGRAGQGFDWLGANTDGWIWHLSNPKMLASVVADWRMGSKGQFRPYGYGTMFDLLADPDAPLGFQGGAMRSGRKALVDHWNADWSTARP